MAVAVCLGSGDERADTNALALGRRAIRIADVALARLSAERLERRREASVARVEAAAVLAGRALEAASASDKPLIPFAIPAFRAVAERTLGLGEIVPARAGSALLLVLLVGAVGGSLLGTVSGAMAQGPGALEALAVLALVHLFVVVPAVGLRSR